MQPGCSTILYGGHSLETALDGIRKAGYAAIELCAIPNMADHLSADASADDYLFRIEQVHQSRTQGTEADADILRRVLAFMRGLGPVERGRAEGGHTL